MSYYTIVHGGGGGGEWHWTTLSEYSLLDCIQKGMCIQSKISIAKGTVQENGAMGNGLWRYCRRSIIEISSATLQRQNTEISKQIFPEKEYRGLSPNFKIHASVSDLNMWRYCRRSIIEISSAICSRLAHYDVNLALHTRCIFKYVLSTWRALQPKSTREEKNNIYVWTRLHKTFIKYIYI